jgi:DNA polymerase I-like protein with 3'-5' exonuclease and polymerase domains
MPLGAGPASAVIGRAVKIMKIRGVPARSSEHGAMILPMLGPGFVLFYPQNQPSFAADCNTFARLVDHDLDIDKAGQEVVGDYEYIDDLQFLIDADPETVAYDTETTSLSWFKTGPDVRTYDPETSPPDFSPRAQILTMQFTIEPGKGYMLPWDHPDAPQSQRAKARLKKQLQQLLCKRGRVVIGQNTKYDCVMTAALTGVRFKIGGDTMMLATLLDENSVKNLDDLTKRYVPDMAGYADRFNLTVDKSRMWTVPLAGDFLDYGCGDTDSTIRLHDHLYREVAKDKRILAHYNMVSLPGLNAFASIEMRGLPVNEDEVDSFEEFMEESVGRQKQALLRQVPKSIKRKHIDKGLKFSRPEFTLDVLFRHPDGFRLKPKVFTKGTTKLKDESRKIPSTSSKDHLPYFYDECPFAMELAQYIKDDRLLGTNIKGFKKKYIIDGVVRPTYSLAKAVTGRSASENPNGQNFPKRGENATRYRRLFVPPPGHYILEADLSQAELRISADMACDHTMLEIYRNFGDIHTRTALIVMGITQTQFDRLDKGEQKLARFRAKAVNFGFIYGMGWRKFIGYAKTQYGVEFTEKEAQRIRTGFFSTYSALPEWHRAMREYARQHKMVRSYSGRIRHLPTIGSSEEFIQQEAERQAINSPVQEFASSLGVMATGRMDDQIDDRYLAAVAFVHDAIYCYVPYEHLLWGARTLKWYMESNRIEEWFGIKMRVPIVADVGFGLNMGDTYEMKGLNFKGGYDFSQFAYDERDPDQVKAAGGLPSIIVPPQRTPPNNGKRIVPLYSYVD